MNKKLTRDTQNKMVAGVAAGLANYFQLDVTWVRIAFTLAAFFGGGGIWIYIILWIAVPEELNSPFTYTDYRVDKDEPIGNPNFGSTFKPKQKFEGTAVAGFVMVGLGAYFLLNEFNIIPYWFRISKLWPLVFVGIGLAILFKANKKEPIVFNEDDFKKKSEEPKNPDVENNANQDEATNQNDNYTK